MAKQLNIPLQINHSILRNSGLESSKPSYPRAPLGMPLYPRPTTGVSSSTMGKPTPSNRPQNQSHIVNADSSQEMNQGIEHTRGLTFQQMSEAIQHLNSEEKRNGVEMMIKLFPKDVGQQFKGVFSVDTIIQALEKTHDAAVQGDETAEKQYDTLLDMLIEIAKTDSTALEALRGYINITTRNQDTIRQKLEGTPIFASLFSRNSDKKRNLLNRATRRQQKVQNSVKTENFKRTAAASPERPAGPNPMLMPQPPPRTPAQNRAMTVKPSKTKPEPSANEKRKLLANAANRRFLKAQRATRNKLLANGTPPPPPTPPNRQNNRTIWDIFRTPLNFPESPSPPAPQPAPQPAPTSQSAQSLQNAAHNPQWATRVPLPQSPPATNAASPFSNPLYSGVNPMQPVSKPGLFNRLQRLNPFARRQTFKNPIARRQPFWNPLKNARVAPSGGNKTKRKKKSKK